MIIVLDPPSLAVDGHLGSQLFHRKVWEDNRKEKVTGTSWTRDRERVRAVALTRHSSEEIQVL